MKIVRNKMLYIVGAMIIGIVFILLIYNVLVVTGAIFPPKTKLIYTADSAEKIYDGAPLTADGWTFTSGELDEGHTASVTIKGSQTNAGSCVNELTVIVSDENGKDVTMNYDVECVSGELKVEPIKLNIGSSSDEKLYDGESITSKGWSLISGALLEGDILDVATNGQLTNIGSVENTMLAHVTNGNGEDITGNYSFKYFYGTLTVYSREIAILSASETKTYDGAPLANNNWKISSGILLKGQHAEVNVTSTITNVGKQENLFEVKILNADNYDVTQNYDIKRKYGILKVLARELTFTTGTSEKTYDGSELVNDKYNLVSGNIITGQQLVANTIGSIIDVGKIDNMISVIIFDENGADITGNYSVNLRAGNLSIRPIPITITSRDASKEYDRLPLTNSAWMHTDGELLGEDCLEVVTTGSIIAVGQTKNTMDAKVKNSQDKDVSSNYVINYRYGLLTVIAKKIRIKTFSDTKIYDATPLICSEWSYNAEDLLLGDTIIAVVNGQLTNAGETKNTIDTTVVDASGIDISNNYAMVCDLGVLKVYPSKLVVKTLSKTKAYDGTPLTETAPYELLSGILYNGDKLIVQPFGSITDIGFIENMANSTVLNVANNNVTYNYEIEYVYGILTVTPINLTINTANDAKTYDGLPLSNAQFNVTGAFIQGDYPSVINSPSITEIGTINNTLSFAILDSENGDVSYRYNVTFSYGELKVVPIEITIMTGSAKKPYDGTPISSRTWGIALGALNAGDYIAETMLSARTEVGETSNDISIKIFDAIGNRVDSHYIVTFLIGALVITPQGIGGSDISDSPFEPNDSTVMYLTSDKDGNIYLRQASFGNYTGSGWTAAPQYDASGKAINPMFLTAKALQSSGFTSNNLSVELLSKGFFLPYYTTNSLEGLTNDFFIPFALQNYSLSYIDYSIAMLDTIKLPEDSEYEIYEQEYRDYVYSNYTEIDPTLKQELLAIAGNNHLNASSLNIIGDVANYIQGAAQYNLKFAAYPKDVDMVLHFLNIAKEGICQHYAAAATMMYRALGIPARYTVGYVQNVKSGVRTEVKGTQAHAWAEVYIGGVGWVQVEVTGGSGGGGDGGDGENPDEIFGEISVITGSGSRHYDGTPLIVNQFIVTDESQLRQGHRIIQDDSYTMGLTTVGKSDNILVLKIVNGQGLEVSSHYKIHYDLCGQLEVTGRNITIETKSSTKVYDGAALTNPRYDINGGTLANGDKLVINIIGTITNPGSCDNEIDRATLKIINGNGDDTTKNYIINFTIGMLTVT